MRVVANYKKTDMPKTALKIILLFIIAIQSLSIFSQTQENRVNKITDLINYIKQNENNQQIFNHLFTDGEIASKKKVLGIFCEKTPKGGYAETYILRDTILYSLRIGSRIYLNHNKDISTNRIEDFVFENETLCYYEESKILETKGKIDSLIYKVEYFLDNDEIIKKNIQGDFGQDANEYVKKIILKSKEKIKEKNDMIK
jgi:hypothetical protein